MDYIYQRNGGGSGFAADWQSIKETMNSPFVLEVKQYEGDGLAFVDPLQHDTKNVKLDGKDYPIEGSQRTSSVRRIDEHTLRRYAETKENLVPARYREEAEKIDGWIEMLMERSIGTIYKKAGRNRGDDLFFENASESIRELG